MEKTLKKRRENKKREHDKRSVKEESMNCRNIACFYSLFSTSVWQGVKALAGKTGEKKMGEFRKLVKDSLGENERLADGLKSKLD